MSTAVKRACDACHRRKVKCDGVNPCRNCSSAQLTCTYNAIPQKKGPKGSRAKVISELRETQRATSLSAKVQSRLQGINSPPCTPSLSPNAGLLSSELVKESIEFFFGHMFPVMPILNRQRVEQQALYMDQNLDTYCLLTSMSAFMLLQPGMTMPGGDPLFEHPGASITSSSLLMEETLRVRKGYDYVESPTLNSLCTSYFLFACCYAIEMHEKAWFHLREAATIATLMSMNQEEKYLQFDSVEASRRRRLYWLLFVTERAYALKYGRPLTLPATLNPPTITDDPTDPLAHQLNGFILLVNLFRPFDDTFMLLWNKTRNECSPSYLAALQKQLSEMHPAYMNRTESQLADMRTNQQWLKTVSWHLSMQNGCVPHNGEELSYQYPIDMARDLLSITSQFQTQSTELLGVPLVGKLMDVTCTLTDVLAMQPSSGDPFSVGPQQHLQSLLQILSSLRGNEHHFLPLLLNKVHDILPRLANPMLQRVPDNICNIDIFDGFGNAGMAQPPVLADFKPEAFKQEPYAQTPAPRMDEMATDSGSSNGAPTAADMNSPFPGMVSSPGVMSPGGIEYSHAAEYNSIPDMVLNGMGQGQPGSMNHQQPQQPQAPPHPPHHSYQSPGIPSNTNMHGQLQGGMHQQQIGHILNQPQSVGSLNQPQAMTGVNHQQNNGHSPPYAHMNQGLMNNILHRPPPQRTNSFAMHQQQQPPITRTVGDFHALQRANSESVAMNGLGMSSIGAEIDFSVLR
ncbi:uncharacterized protein BCR38DRAFT_329554 [Pseudomassariella vexata]|uniref:Zn(2)-C6 fungal-type domain-containing protein n=1 Tax=Pseudomassariella vexata TaxID=1141098 RepID=A0A1Y2EI80_9PEZI|nr:uncharacterized protein BCR38DRAFT_329554 [Pseudomassariella vexata]ORY71004.1 hypothetical protein BCR38DRAFT_329554 [Pseudomassariella vexata]